MAPRLRMRFRWSPVDAGPHGMLRKFWNVEQLHYTGRPVHHHHHSNVRDA
jgi:hypothetical protein